MFLAPTGAIYTLLTVHGTVTDGSGQGHVGRCGLSGVSKACTGPLWEET